MPSGCGGLFFFKQFCLAMHMAGPLSGRSPFCSVKKAASIGVLTVCFQLSGRGRKVRWDRVGRMRWLMEFSVLCSASLLNWDFLPPLKLKPCRSGLPVRNGAGPELMQVLGSILASHHRYPSLYCVNLDASQIRPQPFEVRIGMGSWAKPWLFQREYGGKKVYFGF